MLRGGPRDFIAPGNIERVTPYEIYIDTAQGYKRIAQSADKAGAGCRIIDPGVQPHWRQPIKLNGMLGSPTIMPLNPEIATQLRDRVRPGKPLRLALLNAFGTGLGDNLVGAQAFRLVLPQLQAIYPWIEVDVIRSWIGNKPDYALKGENWLNSIQSTPMRFDRWCEYDAYYDFSGFVALPGFRDTPWPDFHLLNLGVDPALIPAAMKSASRPLAVTDDFARGAESVIESREETISYDLFLHATASTPLRTLTPEAIELILSTVHASQGRVVTDDPAVQTVARRMGCPHLLIKDRSLDELCGALSAVDVAISCNSFALHVANLVDKPTIALYMGQNWYSPHMLPYQSRIVPIEVDAEGRYGSEYKLSSEQLEKPEEKLYFESCWRDAAVRTVDQLRIFRGN